MTLEKYISKNVNISYSTIFRQIKEGLSYLYENNVIHGDISLTNILINPKKILSKSSILDYHQ